MKKTLVKVYLIEESHHQYLTCNHIMIGEEKDIDEYLSKHPSIQYYKEYLCKNSIKDLIDYDCLNARIEPGAIIRNTARIEPGAIIMMGAIINMGASIGSYTMIDMGAVIGGNAIIGSCCHIGANSVIAGNIEPSSFSPVIIEDHVFIGANAVILEGVHIYKNAVIGAGSIVLEDVLEGEVVAGNPARVIKKVDEQTLEKTSLNMNLRK